VCCGRREINMANIRHCTAFTCGARRHGDSAAKHPSSQHLEGQIGGLYPGRNARLEGRVDVAGVAQVCQACRQVSASAALPRRAEVQALMSTLQLAAEPAAVLERPKGRLRELPARVHDLCGWRRVQVRVGIRTRVRVRVNQD